MLTENHYDSFRVPSRGKVERLPDPLNSLLARLNTTLAGLRALPEDSTAWRSEAERGVLIGLLLEARSRAEETRWADPVRERHGEAAYRRPTSPDERTSALRFLDHSLPWARLRQLGATENDACADVPQEAA
jgi:hypothetical protein